MTTLHKDAMMVSAAMTDAFGASVPSTEAGLEKEANQTGFFVYSKTDYDLYLKNAAGAWFLYGNITGARESITVPWGENTAAFFKCADATATMHVHRKTGNILYDSTPSNDGDDQNTLLTSAGSAAQAAQNYTFPEADGNANQVLTTDGAGQLSWSDAAAGSCAASNFTFDGHMIPDSNATYDLGSAEKKVRHLFLSDNSIKFESGDLGVANGNLTFNGEAVGSGGGGSSTELVVTGAVNLSLDSTYNGGTVIITPLSGDTTYTLPAPEPNFKVKFLAGTNWTGGKVIFKAKQSSSKIFGMIHRVSYGGDSETGWDNFPTSYAGDTAARFIGGAEELHKNTITLVNALQGSDVDFYSDGTYWYVRGTIVATSAGDQLAATTEFSYESY